MDSVQFYTWLTDTKGMSTRSSKDVLSRCRRVNNITGEEEITELTIEVMNNSEEFQNNSMYIKSQLRRAVALYLMFLQHEREEKNGQ